MRELDGDGRIKARFVVMDDAAAIANAAEGAHTVWLETPTNPLIEVADIRAAVAATKANGGRVVVDSTFATPLVQRPLELGADIVMHSVTKFLAGHSDALMGAAVTRDPDLHAALIKRRVVLGGAPGALESYLALRGIRTLPLRLKQSMASALTLAERLAEHPAVTRVRYPGLVTDPGHAVASGQMDGFGAILSIEVVGGAAAADRICESTRIWSYASSLGVVESLLERRRRWPAEQPTVDESLIRLSVGIEDVEDLWNDLDAALQTALQ
jgi:cystathionine gamma-synthase